MSHGFELGVASKTTPRQSILAAAERLLDGINRLILLLGSLALIAASVILSYSVVVRFFFHTPTYWQDEAAVFLLVGATFMTTAYVQGRRGHVAIEALTAFLSPRVNAARLVLVDVTSFAFCAFFTWKSFVLLEEAWVDGHVSSSTWAPPMFIPYGVMTAGMALLTGQIFLQILIALSGGRRP